MTARVKSDLKRLNQLYPAANLSEERIERFHEEATTLLRDGYLQTVTYGFQKEVEYLFSKTEAKWLVALKYEVVNGELDGGSDVPGGLRYGCDIEGSSFSSFLTYSSKWDELSPQEQEAYKINKLPFQRTAGVEPQANWSQDRSYGKGGKIMNRYTTYPG